MTCNLMYITHSNGKAKLKKPICTVACDRRRGHRCKYSLYWLLRLRILFPIRRYVYLLWVNIFRWCGPKGRWGLGKNSVRRGRVDCEIVLAMAGNAVEFLHLWTLVVMLPPIRPPPLTYVKCPWTILGYSLWVSHLAAAVFFLEFGSSVFVRS